MTPVKIEQFTITAMEGERPGADTHTVNSDYVERDWLPFIGPNALVLARRINQVLTTDGKHAVNIKRWATDLGINQSDLLLAANRLIRFGLAVWSERDRTLLISRHWPSVPTAIQTPQHRSVLLDLPDVEVTAS